MSTIDPSSTRLDALPDDSGSGTPDVPETTTAPAVEETPRETVSATPWWRQALYGLGVGMLILWLIGALDGAVAGFGFLLLVLASVGSFVVPLIVGSGGKKKGSSGHGNGAAPFPTDMGYSVPPTEGLTVKLGGDTLLLMRNEYGRDGGGRFTLNPDGSLAEGTEKGWYLVGNGQSADETFFYSGGPHGTWRFGANTALVLPFVRRPYAFLDSSKVSPFTILVKINLPAEDITFEVQIRPVFDTTIQGMLKATHQDANTTFTSLLIKDAEVALEQAVEDVVAAYVTRQKLDHPDWDAMKRRSDLIEWLKSQKKAFSDEAMRVGFTEMACSRGFSDQTVLKVIQVRDDSRTEALEAAALARATTQATLEPKVTALTKLAADPGVQALMGSGGGAIAKAAALAGAVRMAWDAAGKSSGGGGSGSSTPPAGGTPTGGTGATPPAGGTPTGGTGGGRGGRGPSGGTP